MLEAMFFNKIPPASNFNYETIGYPVLHTKSEETYNPKLVSHGEGIFQFVVESPRWEQKSHAALEYKTSRENNDSARMDFSDSGELQLTHGTDSLLESVTGMAFGVLGSKWIMSFKHTPKMRFYGLGEKHTGFEKTGHICKFWNTDVFADFGSLRAEHGQTDPLYASIPYVLIRQPQGYVGILINNPYPVFMNLAAEESIANLLDADEKQPPSILVGSYDGTPDITFIAGETAQEVTRKLQRISGITPLPPLWALGYHQCRFGYRDLADLEELDTKFDELEIPCDGLWLDIDYMDAYRVFTVNDGFKNYAKRIRHLQDKGRKIVPILDPGVKNEAGFSVFESGCEQNVFCKTCEGDLYSGFVWPGRTAFPDYSLVRTREWWAQQVKAFTEAYNFDGYWIDMNDPSTGSSELEDMLFNEGCDSHDSYHNQYALGMQQATLDGVTAARPNERPFIISRSGFISTQRYSALWTGDNWSNYLHLREGIAMSLNLSISGVPFNGPDVPGFGGEATPELAADWHKACFLFPFFRNHSANLSPHQEPWQFEGETRKTIIHYIRLRYKLLPYLYQCFRHSAEGDPILRPLYYEFEDTKGGLDHIGDQFMVGSAIMQAPIVMEKSNLRKVYLPDSAWYDASTGSWYEGDQELHQETVGNSTGLYMREGSMIPMLPGEVKTATKDLSEIDIHIILRRSSNHEATLNYICDDGISPVEDSNMISSCNLRAHVDDQSLTIELESIKTNYKALKFRFIAYDNFDTIHIISSETQEVLSTQVTIEHLTGCDLNLFQTQPILLKRDSLVLSQP